MTTVTKYTELQPVDVPALPLSTILPEFDLC